jgi:hypothetical protein
MKKKLRLITVSVVCLTVLAVLLAVYSHFRREAIDEIKSSGTRTLETDYENPAGTRDNTREPDKTKTDSPPRYELSVLNGYITVFYAGDRSNVKQVTGTPVVSLSREEQERLTIGIDIDDDEQLVKLLQDYDS